MRAIFTTAAILGLTIAPAMAQTSTTTAPTTTTTTPSMAPAPMTPGAMQDALKEDLTKAGFTDVQVMPSSFLVRAKDKSGHPMMMVINPDSVTEISNIGKPAAAAPK